MKFFMPTKLYQESDCVAHHCAEIAALGSCALIVTGKHSAKANGAYADVCQALDDAKIAHVLFDEVEQNPSIETVMKARETAPILSSASAAALRSMRQKPSR